MSAMSYEGFYARVEFDAEDGLFVGHLAGINDVVGFHAETVDDLRRAFHEAVEDYRATCALTGKAPEKPYSGKVMLRIAPDVHARAALAAELAGKSLNQWGEEVLATASLAALRKAG
ncbi:type II toxin-antitoxin system HicB family antitoxin [Methylobacterium sp. sgz302541]|uniref:type II toxin-antitoxin system HicB family antitoxin n=1 Tax=unclassified Methylobacterium TaxID=2615210 RepID=UPI003D349F91